MTGWWIEGKLPKEDRKLLSHYPCVVYAPEPEEDEKDVIKESFDAVQYERVSEDLWAAEDLWDLLGAEEGDKLTRLIRDEIRIETNKIYRTDPKVEDLADALYEQYVVDQKQIRKMLSLMEGLGEALLTLTDKYYQVKPGKIDYVLCRVPHLVNSWTERDGTRSYTLVNSLSQAQRPEWFLKHAVRLDRDIYWDD